MQATPPFLCALLAVTCNARDVIRIILLGVLECRTGSWHGLSTPIDQRTTNPLWSSLTGGEPFRQPVALARTVALLLNDGWKVQIESNGTLPPGDLDIRAEVVVSPKAPVVHKGLFPYVKALKYVLSARNVDPADGLPTSALGLVHKARLWRPPEGLKVPIYIQPEDNNEYQDNVQAVINSAMKYGYIMNLQMHKLVGLE